MPVKPYSRYRNLNTLEVKDPKRGITQSLPIRRSPETIVPLEGQTHRYTSYETTDILALKYFGLEELYWHLLDANWNPSQPDRSSTPESELAVSKSHPVDRLPDQLTQDLEVGNLVVIPPLSLATRVERRRR